MKKLLDCKYDSRKSFYGKAEIEVDGAWGQNITLYSYGTIVARIGYMSADKMRQYVGYMDCEDDTLVCVLFPEWDYSATTLRHVKEFLAQYGFGVYRSKRDILADCLTSDYENVPMVIVRP